MTWMQLILGQPLGAGPALGILLGGYGLGCFTTGYYLVRWRLGRDIRDLGSGSVGARNVGRFMGTPGFVTTLLADFAKGAVVVLLTRYLTGDERLTGLAMLAAVLGHIWPLPLGFRGGKGVATAAGATAFYDFRLALAGAVILVLVYLFLRRFTLSGMIAFACLPLAALFREADPLEPALLSGLAGVVLIAHRKNLEAEFTALFARYHKHPKPDQSGE
jgi:glycerol-3-phosphate acyltransferase PlsY